MTDGSGCSPEAASRIARRTKNAASVVIIRPATKFATKPDISDSNEASHEVPIAPPGIGVETPNELNHPRSGLRVINTTAQNIHFAKLPLTRKVVPPSRLKLTPARTSATKEAAGASLRRTWMMSFKSCGTAIASFLLSLQTGPEFAFLTDSGKQPDGSVLFPDCLPGPHEDPRACLWLWHARSPVGDPELDQSGYA